MTFARTGTDMESRRDFVGYAESPPDIRWPGGARLAVNFVLNYEEGSEYSLEDGDGRSDATLTDVAQPRVPRGDRDLGAESMFEYGSRVGFWRNVGVGDVPGFPRYELAAEGLRTTGGGQLRGTTCGARRASAYCKSLTLGRGLPVQI